MEVLTASSHLQVKTALDLCSDYIISLLTYANAGELLRIADTYTLTRVSDYYTNKILTTFDEFTATEQFLALSGSELARYLRDDALHVYSERALYDAIMRWYLHDRSRVKDLNDVLLHVRFGLMSEEQLAMLTQHALTQTFQPAMKYINEARKYHSELNRGHPALTTSSQVRTVIYSY